MYDRKDRCYIKMSFLGIFASLFSGGVYVVESCKDASYATSQREQAWREKRMTYSVNGKDFLTSTGEQVFVWGGKIKSLKTGQIIYDMNEANSIEQNQKYIMEAKTYGKKYICSYKIYNPETQKYESRTVELSTMKPYELEYDSQSVNGKFEWICYKKYLKNNGWMESLVRISKEEFDELGGYIPFGLSPREYFYLQMEKREKERKKMLRRL